MSQRLDWIASLRAAGGRPQHREQLRYRWQSPGEESLLALLLDGSSSMLQHGRLSLAKGVLADWFKTAAQRRQRVVFASFGGTQAQIWFGPAVPRGWNQGWIEPIGGGGGTPLRLGLQVLAAACQQARQQRRGLAVEFYLLTDGRCPLAPSPAWADAVAVVDFGHQGFARNGAQALATAWQAAYLPASDLLAALPADGIGRIATRSIDPVATRGLFDPAGS